MASPEVQGARQGRLGRQCATSAALRAMATNCTLAQPNTQTIAAVPHLMMIGMLLVVLLALGGVSAARQHSSAALALPAACHQIPRYGRGA